MTVLLIKHKAVANCGSFEVRFSDGTPSQAVVSGLNTSAVTDYPAAGQ